MGMGVSQFGNLFRETSDEISASAVTRARAAGIRYFDTAPHYGLGLSERRLGAGLRGVARDEYTLSTKVGRLLVESPETADQLDPEGFIVPASVKRVWDFSREGVLRSVEASLARLSTDRLDIVYLHDPDDFWAEASTTGLDALIELRDQGVVGAVGAGMNQADMLADFVERTDVDVVMVAGRFTLLDQTALTRLLPAAADRGVGVVAAAVYNSGLLSSPTVSDDAHFDYGQASRPTIERARSIASVCERFGVPLPAAAVQYPLRHPAVVSVVLGTRTAEHVDSNLERFHTPIPDELWAELDASGLAPDPIGTLR
ncbi:aldo/keto reductase [Herbiconiux sp. CPCC 205763]|uniref:Aldo/keto reductase n=1 Tax=Herbiconiux aconitum TaxID=2970913 RepID=A0ABT2GRX7_9MICO|nr:aldo/keto reductase [Herbiconiux aconitum]MCS5717694.1 aldo/keto reductase [Herbiconiux aconitum]